MASKGVGKSFRYRLGPVALSEVRPFQKSQKYLHMKMPEDAFVTLIAPLNEIDDEVFRDFVADLCCQMREPFMSPKDVRTLARLRTLVRGNRGD